MAGLLLASAALPQQKRGERVFGDDRTAWILQDVLDVLGDKDQAEAVRTCKTDDAFQEPAPVAVLQEQPRLVNYQQTLAIRTQAYLLPDAPRDQVHRERPQVFGKSLDAKDDDPAVERNIRVTAEQTTRQTAAGEYGQAFCQARRNTSMRLSRDVGLRIEHRL